MVTLFWSNPVAACEQHGYNSSINFCWELYCLYINMRVRAKLTSDCDPSSPWEYMEKLELIVVKHDFVSLSPSF